jgi:ribosomal protein S18 acetylase RimI-like enzyme
MDFRTAAASDVPQIVALVESAYRGEASRVGWTTEADLLQGQRTDPEGVADIIASGKGVVLLAFDDGDLIGCCQLERHHDYGYFGMFAVRPALQGSGAGKTILAEAERIARDEWHVPEMHMTVISVRDDLIAWYQRRGYTRTGKMSPFPYGDERFGLPQRPDLEFELLVKPL